MQTKHVALCIDGGVSQSALLHLLLEVVGALLLQEWRRRNFCEVNLFGDGIRLASSYGLQCCPNLRIRAELFELNRD